MRLDTKTLVFVAAIMALVPCLVAAVVWRTTRTYPFSWVLGNFLAVFSLTLLLLRGTAPDWISIVVANALATGAALAFLQGIRRYRGFPAVWWPEFSLMALAIAGVVYFRYFTDNINARIVVMSVVLGGIGIASGIILLKDMPPGRRTGLTVTGLVFLLGGAAHLLRGADALFFAPVTSLFDPSPANTFFFLFISVAAVSWSLGFILLTGERLVFTAAELPAVGTGAAPSRASASFQAVPGAEVRQQLRRILDSEEFRRSAQMERFLNVVVERSLLGHSEELKEYALGRDVFHRGEDYDPRTDSIVRVEAQRLRRKLRKYYSSEGSQDSILINIPAGSYVPEFRYIHPGPGL